MKVLVLMSLLFSYVFSYSYECSRYVRGTWKGYVKVSANSKTEAEYKARKKWEKMDKTVHRVNCKS